MFFFLYLYCAATAAMKCVEDYYLPKVEDDNLIFLSRGKIHFLLHCMRDTIKSSNNKTLESFLANRMQPVLSLAVQCMDNYKCSVYTWCVYT